MAVCPRCNANVPDGSERCLVCGYGLPGTVAATEDPKSAEPADSSEAPRGDLTEPGGTFPGTTQQVYSTGTDPGVGAIGGSIYGADAERTSVMGVPATGVVPTDIAAAEPPRRSFPFNAVLIAVVAAIAIGLLVLALTSGTGSGSNSPHHGTSTTTKSHHNVAPTTTSSSTTSTTSPSATTTTTTAPTTTTTAPTTTTTIPPTTTTTVPATTTTSSPTTSTTLPTTTTTTKAP